MKYFYCYSTNLQAYLKINGFAYICTAYHHRTMKQFWLYEKNLVLHDALDEWRDSRIKV